VRWYRVSAAAAASSSAATAAAAAGSSAASAVTASVTAPLALLAISSGLPAEASAPNAPRGSSAS